MSENNFEQKPFGNADFADNPESRCAVVLLLDNSGSMNGRPIQQLNEGLQVFQEELKSDSLASKRVEVAIVTFGPVKVETDFISAQYFYAPTLATQADTPMGSAIETALGLLQQRKAVFKANGISYYRPWVFMITDGSPTDSTERAATLIREGETSKAFMFYSVGVDGADFDRLRSLSVREPLKLRGLAFKELFRWLSTSLAAVSSSQPGDTVPLVNPMAPNGWATTA